MKYIICLFLLIFCFACNPTAIERTNGIKKAEYFSPRKFKGKVKSIGISDGAHQHFTTTISSFEEDMTMNFERVYWKVGDSVTVRIESQTEVYINDIQCENILYLI